MQFRRIVNLPPYVFAEVNARTREARRAGIDVIDLGFGNPDIPSPPGVVEKLVDAATQEKNHRYSASRGIPNLRKAVADRYQRAFGVTLDPDTEVINTIGAKEGLSHLMWVLVQPGDVALVPEPFVSIVLANNPDIKVKVDVNAEWKAIYGTDIPMGVTVVSTELAGSKAATPAISAEMTVTRSTEATLTDNTMSSLNRGMSAASRSVRLRPVTNPMPTLSKAWINTMR